MKRVMGADLSLKLQEEVKKIYIHRNTVENKCHTGTFLNLITDKRWLEITSFRVTRAGKLSKYNRQ